MPPPIRLGASDHWHAPVGEHFFTPARHHVLMSEAESGLWSPSRLRAVQEGALAWGRACVAGQGDNEASLVRQLLESLGLAVELYGIGQARHLASVLHGDGLGGIPDFLIITGHGEEGAIIVPECAEEIERLQPFHRLMTPAHVRAHFTLTGSTVLSLGCTTGSDEMADAFLAAGAKAFAGPSGYPDASDAIVFTHLLFHGLAQGAEIEAAVQRARDFAPTLTEWRLWAL